MHTVFHLFYENCFVTLNKQGQVTCKTGFEFALHNLLFFLRNRQV